MGAYRCVEYAEEMLVKGLIAVQVFDTIAAMATATHNHRYDIPGPDPAVQAINDLHHAIDALEYLDLTWYDSYEQAETMRSVDSARTRLEGRLSVLIHRLNDRPIRDELGVTSPTGWLCAATGTSSADARRRVGLANTLAELPLVRAAVLEGTIPLAAVSIIQRARNPRTRRFFDCFTEAFFVDIATTSSCAKLSAEVDDWLFRHDTDGPEPDDPTNDRLHADRVGERVFMRGDFGLNAGLPILAALQEEMNRIAANETKSDDDTETQDSWRPDSNRRAEALSNLLAAGAAAPDNPHRREPSLIAIERPRADGTMRIELPDGSIIPRRLADAWSLDQLARRAVLRFADSESSRTARFVDADGNVIAELDLGRTARLANRAQRRALAARDGGCAFPGCQQDHQRCQAHHVKWWEHGGRTDLDNLVLLCRFHHVLIHTGLFTVETIDHHPVFRRPQPDDQPIADDWHRHPPPRRC